MEFFDAHAHYDDNKFEEERDILLKDMYENGITKIVSAGYSLEGTKRNIELAKKYNFIYTTAGISPNDLNDNFEKDIQELEQLLVANLQSGKILAIGEIGLDYHYDTDKKIQYEAFRKQIDIANKYNLPIVIHTRDAVMDTITLLKENKVKEKGIFHCCPLNRELVKEALKLDFYISMAGPITFKNSKNANEIIEMVPLDKILIETDSPYLAPEPVRGTINNSNNLKYIASKIASVKGLTIQEVAKATYKNALKIYKLNNL